MAAMAARVAIMAAPARAASVRAARRAPRVCGRAPRRVAARAANGATGADGAPAPAPLDVPAELGVLLLRVGVSVFMLHNGLDKLQDPEGFAKFVVAEHLSFLPEPLLWTYAAAAAELVCPVALALGVFARPAAFALFSTMGLAVAFHIHDSGLEGFPLAVVEAHQYGFETAGLYALAFLYFVCAGPGRFSISGGK